MRKTSLVKEITWDWAKRLSVNVCIVFFVFLKLVKPGDLIEESIIQQMHVLQGKHVSRYALESPVPPADLIALSPGYRVPPDLATVPYIPRHTQFALTETATLFQMFEMTLPAP